MKPTALAYSNLGTVHFYAGQYENAVIQMEKARDLGETGYMFWGNLADAYRVTSRWAGMAPGAYEKAVALAEKERVKKPDYARLRSILARYYARLRREPAALSEIAEASRLGPRDVDIMYRSVLVYEALERREQALEAAEAALRNGFSCEMMREGPDLAALRQDHRYQRIEETHCDSG